MTTCPACGWENEAEAAVCAGCGRHLVAGPPPAVAPAPVGPGPGGPGPGGATPGPAVPGPRPDAEGARPAAVWTSPEPVTIRPQTRPAPRTVEPSRDAPRQVDLPRAPRPAETVLRGPAAIRDIPVVVAAGSAHSAVRRRDEGPAPDGAPGTFAAPQPVLAGPGARMCPSCGSMVAADRRFCRCGAQLTGARATDDPAAAVAEGWTRPVFRRAQRAANGGRRVRYDAPLAARAYAVRGAVAGLLILAVASQAPPWGADVRDWVGTRVEQSVPW